MKLYLIFFDYTSTAISSLDANTQTAFLWSLFSFLPSELILCLFQHSQKSIVALLVHYQLSEVVLL